MKVAILISTMDRPDFMIRTLKYYASVKSPHPIYIGDSSNFDNASRINSVIHKLRNKLQIHYQYFKPGFEPTGEILQAVTEKYSILTGDDDFYVPSTLTKCAEFLEDNPGYATCGGRGVAVRLETPGAYGKLKSVKEYPNRPLEAITASQRLSDFMDNHFTVTFTSVSRTENFRNIWVFHQPIIYTWGELFQICYTVVAGKNKVLDYLGTIRQIHEGQWHQLKTIDLILAKEFNKFYRLYSKNLSKKIMKLDGMTKEQTIALINNTLQKYFIAAFQREDKATSKIKSRSSLRSVIGKRLPFLKSIYHRYKPVLHYDVQDPRSRYYKDFEPVLKLLTKYVES